MFVQKSHGICHIRSETRLPVQKFSSIIFSDKYVLAPGAIIAACDSLIGTQCMNNLKDRLRTFQIVDAEREPKWRRFKDIEFCLQHCPNNVHVEQKAHLLYAFNCKDISQSIRSILTGFDIKNDDSILKNMLSCFVVLQIDGTSKEMTVERDIFMSKQQFKKLDAIEICSTPFGNGSFFGTINYGHIANILGINDSLLIVSTTLVNGCEGSGVFDANKKLIGVVLRTTFIWNNENANLSVVGSFQSIVKELLRQLNINTIPSINFAKEAPTAEKFTVYIECQPSWGTGCFVKIKSKKLILTCSHVLVDSRPGDKINCTWKGGSFKANVLFKNPHYNHPYDLAILDVPSSIPADAFAICNAQVPQIGHEVYSFGFPHIRSLALATFSPSIFKGRIIKYTKGMIFTDVSIQAGQSGGPLFNDHFELIGVFVSNTKDILSNVIYPNLNLAVPICDVIQPLEAFVDTGDDEILEQLIAGRDVERVWSLQEPLVGAKL